MPSASACAAGRLKREDCPRTKHDSLFSPWKVLVGPSDWEDHAAGNEGVQRYRILNLPDNFPGLYELAVAAASDEGVGSRRHGPGIVVVVYLGQADNVRARLQQYGRTGSHLDTGNPLASAGKAEANALAAGPGLFREVFCRGYTVVFRCALMGDKQEAEKTEAQLLRVFDYAWNKLQNGACRRDEILLKLEQGALSHRSSLFSRVHHSKQKMIGKKAGIKIRRNGSVDTASGIMENMLPRIRSFVGFRPQLVNSGDNVHKAIDIHKKNTPWVNTCDDRQAHRRSEGYIVKKVGVIKQKTMSIRDSSSVCGVMLDGGSSCLEPPVQGRKRCTLHKGRRVTGNPKVPFSSYTCKVEIPIVESIPPTENASRSDRGQQIIVILSENLPMTLKEPSRQRNSFEAKETKTREVPTDHGTNETSGDADTCGAKMSDNSICNDKVMLGSKRCQLHDGWKDSQCVSSGLVDLLQNDVKLHSNVSESLSGEKTTHAEPKSQGKQLSGRMWFELIKSQRSAGILSSRGPGCQARGTDVVANICGVVTDNGYCEMVPVAGIKRYEGHKGIKVTDASSVPFSGSSGWPSICGARASDGSPCKNQPVAGRKRCALHKGQRSCCPPPPSIE